MFKKLCLVALLALFSFSLAGCMSPKSFVDPTYPKVSYDVVKKRPTSLRLKLIVEFQRDGEHFPKVDSTLRDNAERVLRASGVIAPVSDEGEGTIKIVVNNIVEKGAAAKGFGTGLTFGLAGTTVTDAYEMTISITANGKTIERTAIKHALHTAIGNTTIPDVIETMPTNIAFNRVLEQLILRALRDMQGTGELTRYNLPPHDFNMASES